MILYWLFFLFQSVAIHFCLPVGEKTGNLATLAMPDNAYIVFIVLDSILLIALLIKQYESDKKFCRAIIVAILMRLFFMFWSQYCSDIFVLPNSNYDEYTFFYSGMGYLVKGRSYTGYAMLFGYGAKLFGLSMLYGKFINIILSINSIVILRKMLMMLGIKPSVREKTLWIVCILPNFAMISSFLLRESLLIFLSAVALLSFLRWWKNNGILSIIFSVVVSLFATWLHSGMIVFALGILVVAIVSKKNPDGTKSFSLRNPIAIVSCSVLFIGGFILLYNADLGLTTYFGNVNSLEDIIEMTSYRVDGGSAYDANLIAGANTIAFLINTPVRIFYYLLSPVPWLWRGVEDIISFLLSALFYSYVVIDAVNTFRRKAYGDNASFALALCMIGFFTIFMYSWGTSNSGTAMRHRENSVLLFMMIYAMSANAKESQIEQLETNNLESNNEIQYNHSGLQQQ